jgi:hypothetical protein
MPADQAAGLRRRQAGQPLRCVYCFLDSADHIFQLAQALHQQGETVLLVDTRGRLFGHYSTRSLFDWRQQLERGQLQTLPLAHGQGWYAPGVSAAEPALRKAAQAYDLVVFDLERLGNELTLMPDAIQIVLVEVHATETSKLRAYRLIKTLAHSNTVFGVGLMGDPVACEQVRVAGQHFLEPSLAQAIYNLAQEGDAFAALAVRMCAEEASQTTRYKTGQP